MRSAFPAGIGLRMEAAVGRVGVFGSAFGAHREPLHARVWAVVGQLLYDGEARSAIGAVDERVAVTSIRRVEKLRQAVVAGREVRAHEGRLLRPIVIGGADGEVLEALGGDLVQMDALDPCGGGSLLGNAHDKGPHLRLTPLGHAAHAIGAVQHPALHARLRGQTIDEGAKAHTLDDSSHVNRQRHPLRIPRTQSCRHGTYASLSASSSPIDTVFVRAFFRKSVTVVPSPSALSTCM